jgi:AcrR family transcriptional regulator
MPSITRPHPQGPDRRAAAEAQVLAATERLLVEGVPFTELGVQRIAAAAGIARSTFYLHFRDKTELLVRLAGSLKDELFDLGEDWRPSGPGVGPDGLATLFERMIGYYRDHRAVLAAITETAGYDAEVREFWTGEVRRFAERAVVRLREEQDAGRLGADVDPVLAGWTLAVGGAAVIARHVAGGDPDDDAAVARELALSQWYGVYRRPAG